MSIRLQSSFLLQIYIALEIYLSLGESMILDNYCYIQCFVNSTSIRHTCCERLEQDCARAEKCGDDLDVAPLDKKIKHLIVDFHNTLRNEIALGRLTTYLPPASNMIIMRWDEELAQIAQCWVNACEFQKDECRNTVDLQVEQNFYVHSSLGDFDMVESFEKNMILKALETWSQGYTHLPPKYYKLWQNYIGDENSKYHDFMTMVYDGAAFIGCAMNFWTDKSHPEDIHSYFTFACNYGSKNRSFHRQGSPVYVRGRPCSHCPPYHTCHLPDLSALCIPDENFWQDDKHNDFENEEFISEMIFKNSQGNGQSSTLILLFVFIKSMFNILYFKIN